MYGSTRTARVLLVLLLLSSGAQCVMACAVGPCQTAAHGNLPPCHRHHVPAGQTAPSCSHPLSIAAVGQVPTAHFAPADSVGLPLAATTCLIPPLTTVDQRRLHTPSPPGVASLSTVILRI